MQLLKPESITHYKLSLDSESIKGDQIVCVEQMKFSLMAKSCLCPGLVALITNLIKSNEIITEIADSNLKDNPNAQWLQDYQQGQKYEIYRHKIPENFEGWQFCSIANEIYKESGLLLFALEIKVD